MKPKLTKSKKSAQKLLSCIICKKKNFETWAILEHYKCRRCKNCGMISVNPTPTQEELSNYYEGFLKENRANRKLWEQRKIVYKIDKKWITKFIDHGKVLDVGSSGGQFLSIFNSKKWSRVGVEIENDAATYAQKNYSIKVRVGNITELQFSEKFDLVIIRGVIEHFSDPVSVLKKCSSLLKSGGYLFITATPVGDSFAFDIYREKWHLFTPPGHLHFFTVNLLSKVLKKYGLLLEDHHYQYEETPYANPKKDFKKIRNDIMLFHMGKKEKVKSSPPFPGSMLTAVWKKHNL